MRTPVFANRTIRCFFLLILSAGVAFAALPAAEATMENQKAFKAAYPEVKVTCTLCHNSKIGKKGDLNAYGQAFVAKLGEGNAKSLSEENLRSLEAEDSDGDGATNADELQKSTSPADPESVPES